MGIEKLFYEIQAVLMDAKKHLPDTTEFPGDESWDWAWNELSDEAQESVKAARERIRRLFYKLEGMNK